VRVSNQFILEYQARVIALAGAHADRRFIGHVAIVVRYRWHRFLAAAINIVSIRAPA